ncbi:MAG: CBS domain-containing protein [Actinobacteria bacterium]|nr:CBS domain-containing protein [Actinomycetota bacterium]
MSPRAAWRLESLGFREVYDYAAGKQDWITAGLPTEGELAEVPRAGDVADPDTPTCRLDERLADARERARAAGWDSCVVVTETRVVLGLLRSRDLEKEGDLSVEEAMRPGPSTFRPNVPVATLADLMREHGLPNVPVTTPDGALVGLLRREDAERAIAELHAHHEEGDHEHEG